MRLAEAYLAGRLEPGEYIWSALRVQSGSLLVYVVVTLPVFALWFGLLLLIFHDSTAGLFGPTFFFLYVLTFILEQRFVLKARLLVLTDRRLFLCKTTWVRDRPTQVEAEERRDAVRATLKDKDRVQLIPGATNRPISLRVPFGYRRMASYIRDWSGSQAAEQR